MKARHSQKPRGKAKKLRALYVSAGLDPRSGGPSVSAQNIWIAASRTGIKVTVALPARHPLTASEKQSFGRLRGGGISIQQFPYLGKWSKLKRWGVSLSLAAWLWRAGGDYDVIHAHSTWLFTTLFAALAARRAGRPFVLIPHESLTEYDINKGGSGLRRSGKRLMRRIILSMTDFVIYASPFEQRGSAYARLSMASCAIFHPIFDDRRDALPAPRRPKRAASLRVGFLGRFDPKKNLEVLIEAASQAPGTILKIAGDGPKEYRKALRDLAERCGVAGRAEWLGFIGAGEKAEFFDAIDVLVMPSANEGFGMVAAEALFHGVPVIVSETSGIAELVARYGCGLVIRADVGEIAAALRLLRSDPAGRGEFSRRANRMVKKELSFSTYGKKLGLIYAPFA